MQIRCDCGTWIWITCESRYDSGHYPCQFSLMGRITYVNHVHVSDRLPLKPSSFGGIMVESGALDHTDGGILQIPWFHGSSMAMIMVCKNFRIQIIQIYSDDFRWQCWLQSCGSPWFSPIKKRLNWWIERRLGWGWCEDRRDQCRSRSAEWRWSLGFLWISGGSQRLEKQTIDSIDEHRWK